MFNDKQGCGYTHIVLGCNDSIIYKFKELASYIASIEPGEITEDGIPIESRQDSSIKLMDYSSQNTKQSKYTTGYRSGHNRVEDFGIEEKKLILVKQSLIEMVDQVHSTRQEHILRYSTLSSEKMKA